MVDVQLAFDAICKYTDDGLKQTRDVAAMLRKQQAIELEYSKSLGEICLARECVTAIFHAFSFPFLGLLEHDPSHVHA